jgi:hypothetical protein
LLGYPSLAVLTSSFSFDGFLKLCTEPTYESDSEDDELDELPELDEPPVSWKFIFLSFYDILKLLKIQNRN